MYRKTARTLKYENMRAAKERQRREAGEAPRPFWQPPKLRRVIIVIDYDHGRRVNVMKLYRTGRIDQYRAEANGQPWRDAVGFSGVLEGIRKAYPPVRASA